MQTSAPAQTVSRGDGTVGKALEVLDLVSVAGRPVRFTDLLAQSDHPKATLYRLVQTLVREGMLVQDAEYGTYALGNRLLKLAHSAWRQNALAQVAGVHLEALSARIGATVHLAQLDHGQVLYVDKRSSGQPVDMYSQAGKVGPAYCTGVGKVLLAYLDEYALGQVLPQQSFHRFTEHTLATPKALLAELQNIREAGYGFDREEHEPGIICAAVPVISPQGRCIAALSLTGSKLQTTLETLEERVPDLQAAAAAIGEETQAHGFPQAGGPHIQEEIHVRRST